MEISRWALTLGHAETKIVSVGIGHGEFAESPSLIHWGGVKWRVRTERGVETPTAKCRVMLVDIIDKHAVDRAENSISRMTRKLQFGALANEVDDSVGNLLVFIPRPSTLEVQHYCVEVQ